MKTTIALLSVLLVGLSAGFYLDHSNLSQQNQSLTSDLSKVKIVISNQSNTITKQTSTIKTILNCSNLTEDTYKKTNKYTSVISCIKTRLNI